MSQSKYHTKAPLSYSEKLCTRNLKQIKAVNKAYADAEVLIAITHKNQSSLLNRAVESAINQSLISQHKARIVILDDSSESIHVEELRRISEHPSITLLSAECGSAARARNTLLDWADRDPKLKWVARLDADDELAESNSVEALWARAQSSEVVAVVGSNGLRMNEIITSSPNLADPKVLLNQINLMEMVNRFCSGQQSHELPSCNLLLKTQLKERYPNVKSAEDHWLVLRLLFLYANQVACVTSPLYCIYSLNGNDTNQNKSDSSWSLQRQHLAVAGNAWLKAQKEHECILGVGMEGVVSRSNKQIIKEFYPWSLNDNDADRIQQILKNPDLPMPSITWAKSDGIWRYSTVEQNTKPVGTYLDYAQIHQFLIKLYKAKICALNIKRDNLLIDASNQLIYIDIGRDIRALTSSYFLDMSARLYSIGILGNDDEEMVRRFTLRTSEESFSELPGFAEFYRDLITTLNPVHPTTCQIKHTETLDDVTLLIKASAQDWEFIYAQVAHIVTQLSYPKRFKSVTLLIDSHVSHFLRQYASPDFETVLLEAQKLQAQGIIDVIWQSPAYNPAEAESSIRKTYKKWFNNDEIAETHTTSNAPLLPSIWAFDRLSTRYVLQCDLDVLVGRRDLNHDYISEMLDAIAPEDVQCVGFNIPKKSSEFLPYHGEAGQYPPEVRFGLLDLYRIKDSLPMENPVKDGKFSLTWHRALQAQQLQKGFRSVRGGNPTTFYIHPRNNDKSHLSSGVIRDLVSQALLPAEQAEQFDLQLTPPWCYPTRNEQVIFLLKGRMTPSEKLTRCLDSLRKQSNQNFGIILIDDASSMSHNWSYPLLLKGLSHKTTLIRHQHSMGRIENFILAIQTICTNKTSYIAVLDQDDYLMSDNVVSDLYYANSVDADLVQMPMFRPDKPAKLYIPSYSSPRQKGGSNVWAHLRVFRKSLFEAIPNRYLQYNQEWLDRNTDYATMLPMSEIAQSPLFIDNGYAYCHERPAYDEAEKRREFELLTHIFSLPKLEEAFLLSPG